MKKIVSLLFCFSLYAAGIFAQQQNFVKINVVDCINCTSALSKILAKDANVTFVLQEDFAPDSNDVIEKFSLQPYRNHITWSNHLYDSLSQKIESELIQFCAGPEIGRSGLKVLSFKSCASDELCFPHLSNRLLFF